MRKQIHRAVVKFVMTQVKPMFTNFRVLACPMSNGECCIEFFRINIHEENSHSILVSHIKSYERDGVSRDWDLIEQFVDNERDTGYFGAFYSLMSGNGCQETLCIYGTSSDYKIKNLNEKALAYYHEAFEKYCEQNNYKLLWLI